MTKKLLRLLTDAGACEPGSVRVEIDDLQVNRLCRVCILADPNTHQRVFLIRSQQHLKHTQWGWQREVEILQQNSEVHL